ncbi:MAG: sensor histidine kinase [Dehalococcoidia bacterium]
MRPGLESALHGICQERREWTAVLATARARHAAVPSLPAWVTGGAVLADVLGALVLERAWTQDELRLLLDELAAEEESAALDDVAVLVARQALRDPAVLALAPRVAVEALLRLLHVLAPVRDASLWVWRPGSPLGPVASVGGVEPGRRAREVAREVVVGGEEATSSRALVRGFPILAPAGHGGALVVRALPGRGVAAGLIAQEAASAFRVVLERQVLAESVMDAESAVVRFGERDLRRTGIDLHDGPLQRLAQLAGDARLLRSQAGEALPEGHLREILTGRVDDLVARIDALGEELRVLARSYALPVAETAAFGKALRDDLAMFEARTGVRITLTVEGDLDALPAATKIAILRIAKEAVGNAHRHGDAASVQVAVTVEPGAAHVDIVDDGTGFDVEPTLTRAASGGRLGVLGMIGRARMLGGGLTVESRPGGPTRVRVVLPDWAPLA